MQAIQQDIDDLLSISIDSTITPLFGACLCTLFGRMCVQGENKG